MGYLKEEAINILNEETNNNTLLIFTQVAIMLADQTDSKQEFVDELLAFAKSYLDLKIEDLYIPKGVWEFR